MYSENNTQQIILNRMIAEVSNDVSTIEGSLIYDALSPASNELAQAYVALDQVANKFDLSNLSGDELATRINQRTGLTRNSATYATGVLNITGTATINQGALFQTTGGIQFAATETKAITASGIINIKAVAAGSSGNVPANQITVQTAAIVGITAVTNNSPTINGFDAETDSALLQRYYDKIQNSDTGSNIAHFKNLVKAYTGVGDAKVFPTWNGNNTVKLVIIDANKQVPSSTLVTEVQTYMDPGIEGLGNGAAPFGAFTTIAGATALTINVSFTAVKDTNYSDAQRLANVQASIADYFKSIVFNSTSVSYAQIGATILASQGILDYSNLTVNGGTANIPISATASLCEVPTLGTVTIS